MGVCASTRCNCPKVEPRSFAKPVESVPSPFCGVLVDPALMRLVGEFTYNAALDGVSQEVYQVRRQTATSPKYKLTEDVTGALLMERLTFRGKTLKTIHSRIRHFKSQVILTYKVKDLTPEKYDRATATYLDYFGCKIHVDQPKDDGNTFFTFCVLNLIRATQ